MNDNIIALKKRISELSSSENFVHHRWFVQWHLNIVERMALELCEIYKDADIELVLGLVWVHDHLKITRYNNEIPTEDLSKTTQLLQNLGFNEDYISKLINYTEIFESKMTVDLNQAPIEVKIVSSADAASHMVGPFMSIYWYENPQKTIEQLLEDGNKKLNKDWERKMVLPEAREVFKKYYEVQKVLNGNLPDRFI